MFKRCFEPPQKAIRSLFARFGFKTAKVSNVSNGGLSLPKRVFDSISLQRGTKNGQVSNVSNGLGNSKGIRVKARRSLAEGGAGKAASSGSGFSLQAGTVVGIHSCGFCNVAGDPGRGSHSPPMLCPPPDLPGPCCIELGVRGTQVGS